MAKCNCGKTWNGKAEAPCSGCHEHFKSVSAFDKHRFGVDKGLKERRCLSPEEMLKKGMVCQDGKWVGSERPQIAHSGCVREHLSHFPAKEVQRGGLDPKEA